MRSATVQFSDFSVELRKFIFNTLVLGFCVIKSFTRLFDITVSNLRFLLDLSQLTSDILVIDEEKIDIQTLELFSLIQIDFRNL